MKKYCFFIGDIPYEISVDGKAELLCKGVLMPRTILRKHDRYIIDAFPRFFNKAGRVTKDCWGQVGPFTLEEAAHVAAGLVGIKDEADPRLQQFHVGDVECWLRPRAEHYEVEIKGEVVGKVTYHLTSPLVDRGIPLSTYFGGNVDIDPLRGISPIVTKWGAAHIVAALSLANTRLAP